jgi:putative addiction module antidote
LGGLALGMLLWFINPSSEACMNHKITLVSADESTNATLPREVMGDLGINDGESLYVVKTDAGVLLTSLDPELQESMEAFELLSEKYSNVLRELAK